MFLSALRNRANHSLPRLTLYTKGYCPLCDKAVADLEYLAHRFELEKVFIDQKGNEKYFHKYKYDIPVFFFDDNFLMCHRANGPLLESVLEKYEKSLV